MFENDELMPRFIPKPTATGNTDYLLAPRPMVPELSLMFGGPNGGANVGTTAGAFSSPRTERNAPGPKLPTYLMDLQQQQQEQTSSLSYANWKMNQPSQSHSTVQQPQAASTNANGGVGVGSQMYLNTSVPPPMPQYMPNTMYRNYGRTAPPEFSSLSSSAPPQLYNPGNVDSKIYRSPPAAGDANTTETAAAASAAAAIAAVNARFKSAILPKMTDASSQTEQKSVKDFQDIMMELFLQLSSKQDLQQFSLRLEIIEMQVSYLQNGYAGLLNSLNRQEQLLMEIMDRLGGSEVEVCSNGDDSGDGSGSSGTARTARTAGSARSTDSTESGIINSHTPKTPNQSAPPPPPPPPPPGLPPQISSYSSVASKNYYNDHMPYINNNSPAVNKDKQDNSQKRMPLETELNARSDSDKSILMNELAKKYLPNDKLTALLQGMQLDMPAPKSSPTASRPPIWPNANSTKGLVDISHASYMYLNKYKLLPAEWENREIENEKTEDEIIKEAHGRCQEIIKTCNIIRDIQDKYQQQQQQQKKQQNSPQLQLKKLAHIPIREETDEEEETKAEKDHDILKLNLENIKNQPKLL